MKIRCNEFCFYKARCYYFLSTPIIITVLRTYYILADQEQHDDADQHLDHLRNEREAYIIAKAFACLLLKFQMEAEYLTWHKQN